MTTTAGDPWPPNLALNPFQQWQTCPSCGTWYQGLHQCRSTATSPNISYPVILNSKDALYEEFKRLYRKLVLEDFLEYVPTILTEEDVDDAVAVRVIDRFRLLKEQLVRTGPDED